VCFFVDRNVKPVEQEKPIAAPLQKERTLVVEAMAVKLPPRNADLPAIAPPAPDTVE
jgi:hypothetical protein